MLFVAVWSGYTLTHPGSRTQAFCGAYAFWGDALICARRTHQPNRILLALPCLTAGRPQQKSPTQSAQICRRCLCYTCKSSVFPKKSITCHLTNVSDGVPLPAARCQHRNRSCSCWAQWDATLAPSLREAALQHPCVSPVNWVVGLRRAEPCAHADPDVSVSASMPWRTCVCHLVPALTSSGSRNRGVHSHLLFLDPEEWKINDTNILKAWRPGWKHSWPLFHS